MKARTAVIGVLVIVLGFVAFSSLFSVHQVQSALVLQFGNPVEVVEEPGLHFKYPWRNVMYFDKRILDLDPQGQEILLSDQKRIIVDSFARYRIVDPLEFRKRANNEVNFRNIFGQRLNSAVRSEMGRVSLADLLTAKRGEIMDNITRQMKDQAKEFGIEVVDVRIGRTDLPKATSDSVYNRMRSDRLAEAAKLRAEGDQEKARIEAEADRQRTVLLADAEKKVQILRGEGIAGQTKILGDAYGKDPEFFQFYRTMQAYRESLPGTTLVLSPDSEFFRYFKEVPTTGR